MGHSCVDRYSGQRYTSNDCGNRHIPTCRHFHQTVDLASLSSGVLGKQASTLGSNCRICVAGNILRALSGNTGTFHLSHLNE